MLRVQHTHVAAMTTLTALASPWPSTKELASPLAVASPYGAEQARDVSAQAHVKLAHV